MRSNLFQRWAWAALQSHPDIVKAREEHIQALKQYNERLREFVLLEAKLSARESRRQTVIFSLFVIVLLIMAATAALRLIREIKN